MRDFDYQSGTACCPRETVPDECSCPDGCECLCLECDCPYPLEPHDDLNGDDLFWTVPPTGTLIPDEDLVTDTSTTKNGLDTWDF